MGSTRLVFRVTVLWEHIILLYHFQDCSLSSEKRSSSIDARNGSDLRDLTVSLSITVFVPRQAVQRLPHSGQTQPRCASSDCIIYTPQFIQLHLILSSPQRLHRFFRNPCIHYNGFTYFFKHLFGRAL